MERFIGLLGIITILGLAYLLSNNKSKIKSEIFVIKKNKEFAVDFAKFHKLAQSSFKVKAIGRGFVGLISLKKTNEIVKTNFNQDANSNKIKLSILRLIDTVF